MDQQDKQVMDQLKNSVKDKKYIKLTEKAISVAINV